MDLSSPCHELMSKKGTGFVLAGIFFGAQLVAEVNLRPYITHGRVPRLSVIKGVVFVLQAPENNPKSVLTQRGPDTLA